MYFDTSTPQILYPPPSLQSIPPPPQKYTPPNPQTILSLLQNILVYIVHTLLTPFSTHLIPCPSYHPYGIDLFPAPPTPSTAIVPVRKERRGRSKSPSGSPSSMTLTEGTLDERRPRGGGSGVERFGIEKVRIRGGRRRDGVVSKQEGWAKEAFKL